MKFHYKAIPAKTAAEVISALKAIEDGCAHGQEVEFRQILTVGNSAIVVYTLYEGGELL